RYPRAGLPALIDAINATGYALTFGLHTRIDETIAAVTDRIAAGNIYVNRNIIGAVVGVQPFGGNGLSGTGPKAGGPLYLHRLRQAGGRTQSAGPPAQAPAQAPAPPAPPAHPALTHSDLARAYREFLVQRKLGAVAKRVEQYLQRSRAGESRELPGPVGERNLYVLKPRGRVLALATAPEVLLAQIGAILATGNVALVEAGNAASSVLAKLPAPVAGRIETVAGWQAAAPLAGILHAGAREQLRAVNQAAALRDGPIVLVQGVTLAGFTAGSEDYALEWLLEEVCISTNTAAAGGNANLMTIG
ncbi:MAG: aldehyde dehydrogenase family protein, partial [Gammaproteobacteria bacterium]|nr:aldehyde dehydrogenase family protein [Gammaproteobacteria bacterium]